MATLPIFNYLLLSRAVLVSANGVKLYVSVWTADTML